MKYVRNFESYRQERINEEFLGKLFGNLFNKLRDQINKTKGGKEVEAIYLRYVKTIQDQIEKQTNLKLSIEASAKGELEKIAKLPTSETKNEGYRIYEAEETESTGEPAESTDANKTESTGEPAESTDANKTEEIKINSKLLKDKKTIIDQIVNKIKEMAIKEMDAVLKKYGGAEKNPTLATIIDQKKDQFQLDVLQAQAKALELSGDKAGASEFTKQSTQMAKNIANKSSETPKNTTEYKIGDTVTYLMKDKKDEWDKLNDVQKKNPPQGIISTGKIAKVDGDKYTISYGDQGETTEKISSEIVGKQEAKVDGQEDLTNTLKDIKTKNPENIATIGNIAKVYSDPNKNKAKIDAINKILNT